MDGKKAGTDGTPSEEKVVNLSKSVDILLATGTIYARHSVLARDYFGTGSIPV